MHIRLSTPKVVGESKISPHASSLFARRNVCLAIAGAMASLATRFVALSQPVNGNGGAFTIPFDFASGRAALLVQARINAQKAVLLLDTGSSHTILRPHLIDMRRSELAAPRVGVGIVGDAVGREVTLEVGDYKLRRHRVAVMDLSMAVSTYREKIDGLLGIEFLLNFSQTLIDLKERHITFIP